MGPSVSFSVSYCRVIKIQYADVLMAKKALGKGLGALIGGGANASKSDNILAPASNEDNVKQVKLSEVVPSPMQPRKVFTEENLTDLTNSIREHGVIQPLIVRKVGGQFELIAGERRWRACKKISLEKVPVIVREASDRDVLELAIIENLQREDLNPIDEASAYARLAKEFSLKQDDIAKRVGKNRATVANAMRLLDLEDSVQSDVADRVLSPGHAKVLLSLKNSSDQRKIANEIINKKLTVRAAESLIKTVNQPQGEKGKKAKAASSEYEDELRKVEDRLREFLSTKVNLIDRGKKGKIEIEYFNSDELNRIIEKMGL